MTWREAAFADRRNIGDLGRPSWGLAAGRLDRLKKYVLAECCPQGSAGGKPCWITEWGFPKNTLVNETRMNFRPYVDQRRVLRFFYYAWLDSREGFAVFRCGHLIETGHLAMSPF